MGPRAQDRQHPPRGHGALDGHARPRGVLPRRGLGVPWRGGGRARHGARCRVHLPSTHCPGPGPGLPSRGDSRREALLGAASAPRPRRRIHSPALVPKAEAPRLLRYVCCTRDTLRLELGGPCRAPQGSPPHPEPAASPTCAPGSPEALCLAGPLCPGLWMVVGERSLSPTKYHDQNCCRKAPLSSTAPPHPEFFAAQPTLFYFFFFPVAFWELTSWLLAPFPSSGVLGIRPGPSPRSQTLPGEVGLALPHSAQVGVLSHISH